MLKKIILLMVTMVFYSFLAMIIMDTENDLYMVFVVAYSFLIGTKFGEVNSDNISLNIKSLVIDSVKLIVLKNDHLK